MYVFFAERENEIWKSEDLSDLREFVDRHFAVNIDWMFLERGEKLIFSECGNYSLERCPSHYKSLHQISMIGETRIRVELQN